jgi:hypothetical protein
MRILLLAAGLLLAGNARAGEHELKIYRSAAPITASVSFDENGKSVPLSKYDGPVTLSAQWDGEKGEAAGTNTYHLDAKPLTMKEPAVEWCGDLPKFYLTPRGFIVENQQGKYIEIGLREDGVLIWRRKAK